MHAFTVHPPKPPAPPPPERPRLGRWLAALALLLLVGLVLGAMRPGPLAKVRALQKELAAGKDLPPDQRKAKFDELRTAMKGLSDDQKWELAAPMREKQKAEMDRYFALAPQEKTAYLDERINKMEQFKKEMEQKGRGKGGPPGGPGFGGPPGGGGGAGKGPPTGEQADRRRKGMLDRTTPEERAQRDAFRKDMEARRKQRGLPPGGGRG